MNKKDAYAFGQLIERVHFTPWQKRKLIAAIPFMSEKKLKKIYTQLKKIDKAERVLERDILKMKQDVASGKIKMSS